LGKDHGGKRICLSDVCNIGLPPKRNDLGILEKPYSKEHGSNEYGNDEVDRETLVLESRKLLSG
jgi:hypothetical protein